MTLRRVYRRTKSTFKPTKGTAQKIRIPQPAYRPLQVKGRRRYKAFEEDPWWFIEHRRGPKRSTVGQDPLEARAVSEAKVRGTLPERIVYKALLMRKLSPGIDFDFQSSEQGGRMELGGIVADFIFEQRKLVVQVQGISHQGYLRSQKDKEQIDQLKDWGYTVYELEERVIYDAKELENWLRSHIDQALNVKTRMFLDPLGAEMELDQEEVALELAAQSLTGMVSTMESMVM
jgi:very-short-patch-repair endonuclease